MNKKPDRFSKLLGLTSFKNKITGLSCNKLLVLIYDRILNKLIYCHLEF